MKRYVQEILIVLAGCCAFGAHGAEPNFVTTRPDTLYTNYSTGYYVEGDSPCQDLADINNAKAGRLWDYSGAKFSDVNGEGCDYVIRRLSDGYTTSVHYQNWTRREYFCSNGYTGPYGDGVGGRECRRHPYVPVAKPPICPSCVVGNPIDLAAADKVLTVEDIAMIDGLGFSRTYQSLPRSFSEGQPASLGLAWSSDHAQMLRFTPSDGVYAARISLVRPDGAVFLFMKSDTSGLWISEQDVLRHSLTETVLPSGAPGYLLTLSDGSREFYTTSGVHLETHAVSGNVLVYEYDSSGRLQKVRNQKGRYIEFTYNSNKRLQRVTSSSGQVVEYAYNANKILESVNYGDYIEKYLYTSFSGVNSYLVRIEDGSGNEITSYTYDPYSQGRPASTQRAGGVNRYTADYETNWLAKILSTTPLNANVAYSYHTLLGRRVIDRVETTCPGCVTDAKTYAYDVNLNIIGETHGNTKTCRSYDQSRNLETVRIEGASTSFDCATMSGGSFQKRTVTQWRPDYRVPAERQTYDATGALVRKEVWMYNSRGQAVTHAVNEL